MQDIQPFSLSALEQIAKVIGDRYTGSEISEFFRKAGFPTIRHDGTTKWRFVYNALEQIQGNRYGPRQVAGIVQILCDPQAWAATFFGGHYFHAVFECCKAFDKIVREKSNVDKHGSELMSGALSVTGTLKLNSQQTETQRNEQEGLMFLCIGLMRAVRNPESHEPELDWPITREDALDILSLISFVYRQVDKAIFYAGT